MQGNSSHRRHRTAYGIIGLSALVLVLAVLNHGPWQSTNSLSRLISVERLVEKGTWAHVTPTDSTPFPRSIDVIKVGDRIYSSKPPTYPLLMAGEAMVMKALTGMEFFPHRKDYLRVLLILNQVIPYLLLLWTAFLLLREWTQDAWTINFMLLALGFGVLPFAYAATLNNHTLSAALFFIAYYLVHRIVHRGDRRWWVAALTGFLLGFAVCIELPGGVFAVAFLLLIARKSYALAGIACLALLLPFLPTFYVYHEISGNYKPFYLQGHLYRFEGSYWSNPAGLDAARPDRLTYVIHTLFGFRGLFLLSPLFLLVPGGIRRLWRMSDRDRRGDWGAILAGTLAIMVFVWARTNNYGGACVGMRWFFPFMPLLLLLAWPTVEHLGQSTRGRIAAGLLGLAGLAWSLEVLLNDGFIVGTLEHNWGWLF
ncbi:MAG: hypothetical protein AAGN35_07780 [Bacteroidota bacterium]